MCNCNAFFPGYALKGLIEKLEKHGMKVKIKEILRTDELNKKHPYYNNSGMIYGTITINDRILTFADIKILRTMI